MKKTARLAILCFLCLQCLMPAAASSQPFAISADGNEVTDQKTGLIWRRCSEGLSLGWVNLRRDCRHSLPTRPRCSVPQPSEQHRRCLALAECEGTGQHCRHKPQPPGDRPHSFSGYVDKWLLVGFAPTSPLATRPGTSISTMATSTTNTATAATR